MTNLDRYEINRALAKAIAYKQCGKHHEAGVWAVKLLAALQMQGIVSDEAMSRLSVPKGWSIVEAGTEG